MVFLELRRDSRVTTGNSGFLLCWPWEVQSSIRVVRESGDCFRVTAGQKGPNLGLCPGPNVPLQWRQGYWDCIPDLAGEASFRVEANDSTLLSRPDGNLLEPTEWP